MSVSAAQRANRRGNDGIRVGQRGGGDHPGKSRSVHGMFGMKNQTGIERTRYDRIRDLSVEHVKKVLGMIQVFSRKNMLIPASHPVVGGNDRRYF